MTTVAELRKHCENLYVERKQELEANLNEYFESNFIKIHRPFNSVEGTRHFSYIDIFEAFGFSFTSDDEFVLNYCNKPNFSEDMICKELEELGFNVLTKDGTIFISVPPYKKGKKTLSFAQKWAKRIIESYAEYYKEERKKAETVFEEMLSSLSSYSLKDTMSCDGFTLFLGYKYEEKISRECYHLIKRKMEKNGMEFYKEGDCIGIKVWHEVS